MDTEQVWPYKTKAQLAAIVRRSSCLGDVERFVKWYRGCRRLQKRFFQNVTIAKEPI